MPAWTVFIPWAWTNTDIFRPPPPHLVHVVIEWPLKAYKTFLKIAEFCNNQETSTLYDVYNSQIVFWYGFKNSQFIHSYWADTITFSLTFYTAVNTSYQKTSEDQSMDGEVQLRKNNSKDQSFNGKAPSQPFDVETIIKVDKSQKFFCIFAQKQDWKVFQSHMVT